MTTKPPDQEVPALPAFLSPPPEKEALDLGLEAAVFDPLEQDAAARAQADDTRTPPLRAYLLLDASSSPDIQVCLNAFDSPSRCLFDGAAFDELSDVGPWLVELRRYADVWDWFVEDGYGQNWGIVLHSRLELMKLKVQMKKFIKIEDEAGDTHFFKFYRPKHFNTYVPAFDADQLRSFARGVETFLAEGTEDPRHLIRHRVREGVLTTDSLDLSAIGHPLRITPPSPDEAKKWIEAAMADLNGPAS
jgi:hypothetical protein